MKRRKREKLPPVPTGTEVEDMEWRELTPYAEAIFETLPKGVSEEWASTAGVFAFWRSMRRRDHACREFGRTPTNSSLWLMRVRQVKRLDAHMDKLAGMLVAALRRSIYQDWPRAMPEQVLLLILQRLRNLTDELFTAHEAGEIMPALTASEFA